MKASEEPELPATPDVVRTKKTPKHTPTAAKNNTTTSKNTPTASKNTPTTSKVDKQVAEAATTEPAKPVKGEVDTQATEASQETDTKVCYCEII